MHEEDGILEEIICKNASILMSDDDCVWCDKKGIICYKSIGEECSDEEFEVQSIV